MNRARMLKLLTDIEPSLMEMLADVLRFEQENISYRNIPGRADKIDEIIDAAAKAKLGKAKGRR